MQSIASKMPRPIRRQLPSGACDTHSHVLGPFDVYPLQYPPDYPVPLAPVGSYLQMLELAGLERGVLVQPTQQDCRVDIMLDALDGAGGRLRGVAAARAEVSDADLVRMWEAGVTGLRFVEAPAPSGAPREGAVGFDEISALCSRMRNLDWAIHVWGRLSTLIDELNKLLNPGLPIVFEHMGMLDVGEGTAGRDFQAMLALLREGRIWVKLSVCRCSALTPDYPDLRPFVDALIQANPEQLLWGSDWPFIRMQGKEPDVSALVELQVEWINDAELEWKLLADNPARLFGFQRLPMRNAVS